MFSFLVLARESSSESSKGCGVGVLWRWRGWNGRSVLLCVKTKDERLGFEMVLVISAFPPYLLVCILPPRFRSPASVSLPQAWRISGVRAGPAHLSRRQRMMLAGSAASIEMVGRLRVPSLAMPCARYGFSFLPPVYLFLTLLILSLVPDGIVEGRETERET